MSRDITDIRPSTVLGDSSPGQSGTGQSGHRGRCVATSETGLVRRDAMFRLGSAVPTRDHAVLAVDPFNLYGEVESIDGCGIGDVIRVGVVFTHCQDAYS